MSYRPDPELLILGEPLLGDEIGSTFMRYPGPCGLHVVSQGLVTHLSPPGGKHLFMFRNQHPPVNEFVPVELGIRTFGVLAVFNTERLSAVKINDPDVLTGLGFVETRPDTIILAVNKKVSESDYFWMPPEMFFSRSIWATVSSREDMLRLFGGAYDTRLKELRQNVNSYMEEVSEILGSGKNLQRPWYTHTAKERNTLSTSWKIKPRWGN